LWGHQTLAVQAFLQHRCGILEMLMGTEKRALLWAILQELTTAQAIESAIITTNWNHYSSQ